METRGQDGSNPLLLACLNGSYSFHSNISVNLATGHLEVARCLLYHGADIHVKYPCGNCTCMHLAVQHPIPMMVPKLCKHFH